MSPSRSLSESLPLPFSASELALARSRSYALFGQLFLSGLSPEVLSFVQVIPELAGVLPETFDEDEAAADYQHLFGFNVFAHESIFLDPAGLLGGPVGEAVLHSFTRAGYDPGTSSDNADHIGHELNCLAFLCGAEAEAWEDDRPNVASRIVLLQKEFLDQHLLGWLPPLALSIRQQNQPFYSALADLALDLATSHRSDTDSGPADVFLLPEPPDLLADEQAGLRDIVAYLLTPAYSGVFLARDDIGRLAHRQTLPRGFGGRRQMLQNLLRSAANYDMLEMVLQDLGQLTKGWETAYGEMAADPHMQPFIEIWQARAAGTLALVRAMHTRLQSLD
jgi:TorA maturation chaperone TorD